MKQKSSTEDLVTKKVAQHFDNNGYEYHQDQVDFFLGLANSESEEVFTVKTGISVASESQHKVYQHYLRCLDYWNIETTPDHERLMKDGEFKKTLSLFKSNKDKSQLISPIVIDNSRYCGLHISRDKDGKFVATYIDPLGANPEKTADTTGLFQSALKTLGLIREEPKILKADQISKLTSSIPEYLVEALQSELGISPQDIILTTNELQNSSINESLARKGIIVKTPTVQNSGPIITEILNQITAGNISVDGQKLILTDSRKAIRTTGKEESLGLSESIKANHFELIRETETQVVENLSPSKNKPKKAKREKNEYIGVGGAKIAKLTLSTILLSNIPTLFAQQSRTRVPTLIPTNAPSLAPTRNPTTTQPTLHPITDSPTPTPSFSPSFAPTTVFPTRSPTDTPTYHPTFDPTKLPTLAPTFIPTHLPSGEPTVAPTFKPSFSPTGEPTFTPTFSPSNLPTHYPTTSPSQTPTEIPSWIPSLVPSLSPTGEPTNPPTLVPTLVPSVSPSGEPTKIPTYTPSNPPTIPPTMVPTDSPSAPPTDAPTFYPTLSPTGEPSFIPTHLPSGEPTVAPTFKPSFSPTGEPTWTAVNATTFSVTEKYSMHYHETTAYVGGGTAAATLVYELATYLKGMEMAGILPELALTGWRQVAASSSSVLLIASGVSEIIEGIIGEEVKVEKTEETSTGAANDDNTVTENRSRFLRGKGDSIAPIHSGGEGENRDDYKQKSKPSLIAFGIAQVIMGLIIASRTKKRGEELGVITQIYQRFVGENQRDKADDFVDLELGLKNQNGESDEGEALDSSTESNRGESNRSVEDYDITNEINLGSNHPSMSSLSDSANEQGGSGDEEKSDIDDEHRVPRTALILSDTDNEEIPHQNPSPPPQVSVTFNRSRDEGDNGHFRIDVDRPGPIANAGRDDIRREENDGNTETRSLSATNLVQQAGRNTVANHSDLSRETTRQNPRSRKTPNEEEDRIEKILEENRKLLPILKEKSRSSDYSFDSKSEGILDSIAHKTKELKRRERKIRNTMSLPENGKNPRLLGQLEILANSLQRSPMAEFEILTKERSKITDEYKEKLSSLLAVSRRVFYNRITVEGEIKDLLDLRDSFGSLSERKSKIEAEILDKISEKNLHKLNDSANEPDKLMKALEEEIRTNFLKTKDVRHSRTDPEISDRDHIIMVSRSLYQKAARILTNPESNESSTPNLGRLRQYASGNSAQIDDLLFRDIFDIQHEAEPNFLSGELSRIYENRTIGKPSSRIVLNLISHEILLSIAQGENITLNELMRTAFDRSLDRMVFNKLAGREPGHVSSGDESIIARNPLTRDLSINRAIKNKETPRSHRSAVEIREENLQISKTKDILTLMDWARAHEGIPQNSRNRDKLDTISKAKNLSVSELEFLSRNLEHLRERAILPPPPPIRDQKKPLTNIGQRVMGRTDVTTLEDLYLPPTQPSSKNQVRKFTKEELDEIEEQRAVSELATLDRNLKSIRAKHKQVVPKQSEGGDKFEINMDVVKRLREIEEDKKTESPKPLTQPTESHGVAKGKGPVTTGRK